jgi:hypothetical protein
VPGHRVDDMTVLADGEDDGGEHLGDAIGVNRSRGSTSGATAVITGGPVSVLSGT